MDDRTRDPGSPVSLHGEPARYRELLEPLSELTRQGAAELPAEELPSWEAALQTLRGYHGDHLELEEAVAAFARALWVAPAWAEPPARIAEALVARGRHWQGAARGQAMSLAATFAERALSIDPACASGRRALARLRLAEGELAEAERAAAPLPSQDGASLGVRSDIAEARGDLSQAIALRQRQLELETEPGAIRQARNKLGLLQQAAGDLGAAIATHRANLAEHPDFAWGRVNLAAALEASGSLLEAYAEVESALTLGLAEAQPFLDTLAQSLDRLALGRFRTLLRTGQDGDVLDLFPASPAAAEA